MQEQGQEEKRTTLAERLKRQESVSVYKNIIPETDESAVKTETPQKTADGYERRTPVQIMYVSGDYKKKKVMRVVKIAIVVVALALLVAAIASSGLISFK